MLQVRIDYIKRYAPLARQVCQGTGLFPSVMLAQGILESANGKSALTELHHNHFGIKKGVGWTGKTVVMPTLEWNKQLKKMVRVPATWRSYSSAQECFQDRVRFLKDNERYGKAGVFSAKTPLEQLSCLHAAGYATDPKYVSLVYSLIEHYKLEGYD